MAGRPCKICHHARRAEIETAIIRGDSKRTISTDFEIGLSAIYRHSNTHMINALAETEAAKVAVACAAQNQAIVAVEQARQNRGLTVMGELERCFDRVNLIFDACDEWLRDPLEPHKYFIGPRATEIDVLYTVTEDGGAISRFRDTLQNMIDRIEGDIPGGQVVLVQSKHADPRDTLLKAAKSLHNSMSFLAKLRDQIGERDGMDTATSEAWAAIREIIIEELADHPEIKVRIVRRLAKIGA